VAGVRRGLPERVAAWAATGPPGHLWSTAVDVVLLWLRYGAARLRGRDPHRDVAP
jgi:hypothetical protein